MKKSRFKLRSERKSGLHSPVLRMQLLILGDIEIPVHFKRVKYLRIVVNPYDGNVRISAPHVLEMEQVAAFADSRKAWIIETQKKYRMRPSLGSVSIATGNTVPFLGGKLPLVLVDTKSRYSAELKEGVLILHVKPDSKEEDRRKLLEKWYRKELQSIAEQLMPEWEQTIGIRVSELKIRKMKTRWGSCNIRSRRIWLNLELIRYPIDVIETILVHEMIHFLERGHNKIFYSCMTKFLPNWKANSAKLKCSI